MSNSLAWIALYVDELTACCTLSFKRNGQLDERKKQLEKRIEANLHGIASSETDLGPFEDLYGAKKEEMASIYRDAKASHKEAINVLIKGFSYHPDFLRPQDSFHATPFVPK